jgi:hypothetical protein
MKRTQDKAEIAKIVSESYSIRQVLIKLGLVPLGGNYTSIRNLLKKLDINTSHFTGKASNKGKSFGPKRPINDYLSNQHKIKSYNLKRRLISEGYLEHKCYKCELKQWNDKPIPIELEHKDGNSENNSLDNLTILCPNCHAQTPTYRRRKS